MPFTSKFSWIISWIIFFFSPSPSLFFIQTLRFKICYSSILFLSVSSFIIFYSSFMKVIYPFIFLCVLKTVVFLSSVVFFSLYSLFPLICSLKKNLFPSRCFPQMPSNSWLSAHKNGTLKCSVWFCVHERGSFTVRITDWTISLRNSKSRSSVFYSS